MCLILDSIMRRHLSLKTQGMNGLRDPLQASLPVECPPKLPLSLLNSNKPLLFLQPWHCVVLHFQEGGGPKIGISKF